MTSVASVGPTAAAGGPVGDAILDARILIVDDKEANVVLLERMLRGAGYRALTVTQDPRTVRALHETHRYDLILLDLQMPGMDGFAVMEGLMQVEQGGYLPVLVITAQPGHKLRALQAGARDFVSKPFDMAEVLTRVHNMLEVRLLHVEIVRQNAELKRLFDEVVAERQRSERLALGVAPDSIVARLQARPDVREESLAGVTVLVADVVGFADLAAAPDSGDLHHVLEELFAAFDRLAHDGGLRKVKTLGNSYMAAAGVPTPDHEHAARTVRLALAMRDALEQFNGRTASALQLRIGIASGTAVAAVIGRRQYLYDLWGDAVAIAARMESHGVAGRVQLSNDTRLLLDASWALEVRGTLEVEGLGAVQTWFLP